MGKIGVLIVDDYPVVREGLRAMLATDQDIEIMGEASDGIEAVLMATERKPNVVLMDIRMSGIDGIEATHRIKDRYPSTAVIVFTMYDDDDHIIDAVRAGANAYLLKDTPRELLLHTIRTVSGGATLIKTSLLHKAVSPLFNSRKMKQEPEKVEQETETSTTQGLVLTPREQEALTPREQEVLKVLVEGQTNKEIGKELGITEDTVKKHVQNILAKLDASSRAGAAAKATRDGLIK